MELRLVTSRIIRCFSRLQPSVTGQRSINRCTRTMQRIPTPVTSNISAVYHQQYRSRRTGNKKPQPGLEESHSDDEDDRKNNRALQSNDREYEVEPGAKIITYKLENPRADRLVRKVLNISAKSVEELFYQKKIYLNDETLIKKGQQVDEGDVLTVALGETSGKTARGALIEVLEIIEHEKDYSVKVSRHKNTLVNV